MRQASAGGIVIDYFFQCGDAPVMHVGRGQGDITQCWRAEFSHIFRQLRMLEKASIGSRILGGAGVEEEATHTAIAASFEPDWGEVPAAVALEAAAFFTGIENDFASFGGLGNGVHITAPAIPVVGRSHRNNAALKCRQSSRNVS